ncbi:MAG: hypothetical protein ACLQVX_01205 [Limisphaerales bacterium]
MTSSAATSALLSEPSASEDQLGPPDSTTRGPLFDSFMAKAASKPDTETTRKETSDAPSDGDPGAPTSAAAAKGTRAQDQAPDTSQILPWLPNWFAASASQLPVPTGAPAPSVRVSLPLPAAGEESSGKQETDSSERPQPAASSTAPPGLLEPADSSLPKAGQQGTQEPSDPDASKDPNAGQTVPAAPTKSLPAKPAAATGPATPATTISSTQPEHGMSVAPQTDTMPAPNEVNEIATHGGQNLPGAGAEVVVPPADARERRAGGAASESDSTLPSGAAQPGLAAPEPPAGQEVAVHTDPSSSQTGAVEAVRRAIDDAAAGLQRGNGASVSLVLRPDANIQLSLHVSLQHGHLDAVAVLEHGDFSAIGAEWTGLQSRLAEQGVRLAPLASSPNLSMSFSGGESHLPGQDRQTEYSTQATEGFTNVAAIPPPASRPTARNQPSSGQREWWA